MQLSARVITLSLSVLAAFAAVATASPAALGNTKRNTVADSASGDDGEDRPIGIVSLAEMKHFLATTDAEITYIGPPLNELSTESAQIVTVTFCSQRSGGTCGGSCTVVTSGPVCIAAPGTNCLSATNEVVFCDGSSCNGSCNGFNECGTRLANNFCFTPGTKSISIPAGE